MVVDPASAFENGDPATQAFEQMRGEMALVRRAVERLAAERADIIIPDYSATLNEIAQRLGTITQFMKAVVAQPAMQITPDEFANRINAAAVKARRTDHAALADMQAQFHRAAHDLRTVVQSARTSIKQRRYLYLSGGAGVLVGIFLWAIIPGLLARSVPPSWHWPERIAARTLRLERWSAGERLLTSADPMRWRTVLFADRIVQENWGAIAKCQRRAERASTSPRCVIMIGKSKNQSLAGRP